MAFNLPFFLDFVFTPPGALLRGLWITVYVTIVSMLLGVVFGMLLAVGGLSRFRAFRMLNQAYIAFFRGTPMLLQIMLIYFGAPVLFGGIDLFPPNIIVFGVINLSGAVLAGIITFALHEAAAMSEITRAGILSIDPGQTEAAKAIGMKPNQVMRYIVLPQAVRVIVPPLGNQCNAMFKTTSLLSVIAVPELFLVADSIHAATYRTFEVYLGVSVYYLALTGIWTLIQNYVEHRISRGFAPPARKARRKLARLSSEEIT